MRMLLSLATVVMFAVGTRAEEPAAPSLEQIKKFVGEWVEADKDGKPTDKLVSQVRVTAGGSAVREILFPNTDMEMVSIYTQEGPKLVMTHYCILGNAPRMEASAGKTPNTIVFKCVGGGNVDLNKGTHMNQTTVTIIDNDHLKLACCSCKEGKESECHEMHIVRKK